MTASFERLATALADHYRIEREIGSGGMATVYLAQDIKHDRQVAVKVLRPELAATLGPDRFPREIRILAKLQHPHVLPLLDSGESAGFLYYVMPYVEGESLRQKLERDGQMPVHEAVRVLREVADALAYAHAHHVLHRDIKPDNVMLSGRHALVTDFGVAKAVSDAGGEKLTTVGVAVGTPTYMSPEQATGDVNTDHRSDIYALGILGYEMLSGKPPFVAPTAQAVLSAQVLERPKPVTERRAAVPEVLSDLLLKCLEKNPADRWQSADEVVHALEALGTPSGGITPTNTRPLKATGARAPAPNRRWVMAAVAGLVVIGAAVGITFAARGDSTVAPNHIAVLPIQDISGSDGQFVDAMHDQLIISLGQAGGLTVAPRSAMIIYKTQPKPMAEVARELKVGAILEGTVFRTGDQMRINVQLTEPRSIRQLWSHSYQINVRDVLGAQDSVVRQIAAGIRQSVLAPGATPSP